MKKARDRFSGHSGIYKKYRPHYPPLLYKNILQYARGRGTLWDCATGNGQVASALAPHFQEVFATDISSNQLNEAPAADNIRYSRQRAEHTGFEDDFFDLITVAQAIHWFDIPAFLKEALRVGRSDGILAVWGYGLLHLNSALDPLIRHFYTDIAGPYWDGERAHIDSRYASIPFNLEDQQDLSSYKIEQPMDLRDFLGYLTTWSSVQNYMRAKGENPVENLAINLKELWKPGEIKMVYFPIFGIMGRLAK